MTQWDRLRAEADERAKTTPERLFVYALIDPRDQTVRYVGLTSNPRSRLKSHRASTVGSEAKRAWMVELREAGVWPRLEVLAELYRPVAEAREVELAWTEYFATAGARLLNAEARWFPPVETEAQ